MSEYKGISKLNKNFIPKEPIVIKPVVEKKEVSNYNKRVKLQLESQADAHLFYVGEVSGDNYEWQRAGSITGVWEEDVPALLEKKINSHSCCGGSTVNLSLFVVVE